MNLPVFRVVPHMCVKPRKLNTSGLPSPRCFRFLAACRPNSIRRVLSGCKLQPELLQALPPFLKKPLRVGTMFESHDDIIRVADDDHIARSMMFTPMLDP